MHWQTIAVPLTAFLLGSIPFGLLIARSQGINIRDHGSGNIGATNVLRVVGKKYGITCFVLDFLKGLIPTLIALSLIRYDGMQNWGVIGALDDLSVSLDRRQAQALQVVSGLCAILGHNYSPWVGFKGGKGVATSAGVIFMMMPFALPILFLLWFILFKTTRYVSVASIISSVSLPLVFIYGSWHHNKFPHGEWNESLLTFAVVVATMSVWKHRSNIRKLLNGTENKFAKKRK